MAVKIACQGVSLGHLLVLISLVGISLVDGYLTYQQRIPNGNNVPHPCKINYMWKGVGHEQSNGGGARNRFGKDFASVGNHKWTPALCNMDSDGDGMTNGQELGDPRCIWTEGQIPERTINITHPGVCDPYGSAKCAGQDSYVSCELDKFSCDSVNNSDIRSIDVKFPKTKVPNKETTYMCMTADIPSDGDYFLVAAEALLDNINVMHHLVIYGCTDDDLKNSDFDTPKVCPYGMKPCQDKLWVVWTVGLSGVCLPKNVGFRFGKNGYKKIMMEYHWNNPFRVDTYYDASGLRLYYEPNRAGLIEAGVASLSQGDLIIPPGQSSVAQKGVCSSECSSLWLNQPIQVFDLLHHMHYLGKSQVTNVFRNGTKHLLQADMSYSYDSPVVHRFNPSFEIRPGDRIETDCVFTSVSKDIWTYGGLGTSDEMCVSLLTFYPASAMKVGSCGSIGPYEFCQANYSVINPMAKDCPNYMTYFDLSQGPGRELLLKLRVNCNTDDFCRPECKEIVKNIRNSACFKSGMWEIFNRITPTYADRFEFIARMNSCKEVKCDSVVDENINPIVG